MVEPSVPELRGQVSFDCGSCDGPLKISLVTMWELMKPVSTSKRRFNLGYDGRCHFGFG